MDLLAPIVPTLLATDLVVLADWLSTMPALGFGFLPERTRKLSRNAALSRSKVPSMRHLLNQW